MMFAMRAMKTSPSAQALGFFDVELRVQWLEAKGNPLTLSDEQKESNRQKSKLRARIEYVFGYMSQSMKGFYLRYIGRRRNAAVVGLIHLMSRCDQNWNKEVAPYVLLDARRYWQTNCPRFSGG